MSRIVTGTSEADINFKVILIGDQRTGKSNLFERLEEYGEWNCTITPTIGVTFLKRAIKISNKSINLQLWDISGSSRFHLVRSACYRKAYAVCVVYDITNKKSFLRVEDWLSNFREFDEFGAQIVLVGNKCDLEDERQVSYEEAREFAEKKNYKFVEVSAKALENVNYLARLIAIDLAAKYLESEKEPQREISKFEKKPKKDDDVIKLKGENEGKKKSVCTT